MNKISKILFCILIILSFSYVKADCTADEINKLKKEADKIDVTYEHLGGIETEYGIDYGQFEVQINNIADDFYLKIHNIDENKNPENNMIKIKLYTGKQQIDIYSTKCEVKVDEISFKLPRYNIYSEDPLCEGVNSNEFSLCRKYYDYYVSYDEFIKKVNNYRLVNNITNENEKQIIEKKESILIQIIKSISKYKEYILVGIVLIILIMSITIIIKKKKKRGVLQ